MISPNDSRPAKLHRPSRSRIQQQVSEFRLLVRTGALVLTSATIEGFQNIGGHTDCARRLEARILTVRESDFMNHLRVQNRTLADLEVMIARKAIGCAFLQRKLTKALIPV